MRKWIRWIAVMSILLAPAVAVAHLCNDVFAQAKDNLAVKVDIRDGQLRVGKEASFRVYLLNTMDRDIARIGLDVITKDFETSVKPDPTWRTFPCLRAVRRKGKKQYFEVTLRRKRGVPDGRYKIDLCLNDGRSKGKRFKTVDLDSAAGMSRIPRAGRIAVDGTGTKEEWGDAFVINREFYNYVKRGKYYVNAPVPLRRRPLYRVVMDDDYLYCLFVLKGSADASADKACVYAAATSGGKPVKISFDRVSGKVECGKGTAGVAWKMNEDKSQIECKIPLKLLGVSSKKGFYANFTRETGTGRGKRVDYWKANSFSEMDPIVYGHLRVAE